MLKFLKNYQTTLSLCQTASYSLHVTEKPFNKITDAQLKDYKYVRSIFDINIPGKSKRSQRGLFHGKLTRSTNNVSDADNRTKRWLKPNIQPGKFYSHILGRKLQLEVSTKTIRCIRKYGGFDNYILLTKPKNLDSFFGEYLRTLMIKKLQDPSFEVGYIVKSRPIKYHYNRQKHFFRGNDTIWYPKDIRYEDHTQDRLKYVEDLSKKERAEIEAMKAVSEKEETAETDPLVLKYIAEDKEEMERLEPYRKQALARLEEMKKKKRKLINKTEEMADYYAKQGFSAEEFGDNVTRPRKKYERENRDLD